jgi:exocyst complex protein 7
MIFFKDDPLKSGEKTQSQYPFTEKYIRKILEAILSNIKQKKSEYKDLPLSYLFLLNNHQYMVKRLHHPDFKDVVNEKVMKDYNDLIVEDENEYLKACWDKGVEPLKDLSIPYEPNKGAMKSTHREAIKKKFKTFFDCFQNVYDTQQKFNIPDIELREHMRAMTKSYVIPHYEAFFKKYGNSDFTTNRGKYIRYDINTIEDLFIRLYKTDQEDKDSMK